MQTEQPQQPPPVHEFTEADWIAADIANNRDKPERKQEMNRLLLQQINYLRKVGKVV